MITYKRCEHDIDYGNVAIFHGGLGEFKCDERLLKNLLKDPLYKKHEDQLLKGLVALQQFLLYHPEEKREESREYIVDVEWFYDIMPSNKHRKKESVFAPDHFEAAVKVERMYPNATIHSSVPLS